MADDDWGWWAGRDEHLFDVGPFPTKGEAVAEALAQDVFREIETENGWQRLVYFAECRGLHYDCGECGPVPKACDACVDYLDPEEVGGTFADTRNAGSVMVGYDE